MTLILDFKNASIYVWHNDIYFCYFYFAGHYLVTQFQKGESTSFNAHKVYTPFFPPPPSVTADKDSPHFETCRVSSHLHYVFFPSLFVSVISCSLHDDLCTSWDLTIVYFVCQLNWMAVILRKVCHEWIVQLSSIMGVGCLHHYHGTVGSGWLWGV